MLDQTATSSKGVIAGYFLSDYLMPEQSTRARNLALEKRSYATVRPFKAAAPVNAQRLCSGGGGRGAQPRPRRRAGEQTQVPNAALDFCCPQLTLTSYRLFS